MSRDAVLGALAGACVVIAVWEALGAIEQVALARTLGVWLAPLRGGPREPTLTERRRLAVVATLTLLAGGWLLAGPLPAAALAAGGPSLLQAAMRARRARWRLALTAGAPAVARSLAGALAGGHSIRGALVEAASAGGCGDAADGELMAAAAALSLGERTDDVLERLRVRAQAPAWDTIVAAILLQRDAGGDLAALLRTLAVELEAGRRAEADARAATAQARFTAWIVAALPAGGAALAELAHPGALASLVANPISMWLTGCALLLQALALLAVRRLARMDRW